MKIKSLILGSAAALVAVSGARAADAVMAPEPEPVDYVRVCDAYGAGYFYIPGTETCLKFDGYVFYQVGTASGGELNDTPSYHGFNTDGWSSRVRTRLNITAKSDTELGTLTSWMRLQADWYPNSSTLGGQTDDGAVKIDQAWVMLGGFAAGYGDSLYQTQFNNSGWNGGSFSWSGLYYNGSQSAQMRYEFGSKDGISGAISLERLNAQTTYVPNIVGRLTYGAAWGTAGVAVAYDPDRNGEENPGEDNAVSVEGAIKLNVPSMPGSAFKVQGWYNSAYADDYSAGSPVGGLAPLGFTATPKWSVMASFLYQATPDLGLIVSGQYFSNVYAFDSTDTVDDTTAWAAEVSAVWTPVKNFEVRPEIVYQKAKGFDGTVSGYLRFTRYF